MTILEKMTSEFKEYDHETKLKSSSSWVEGSESVLELVFMQGPRRPTIKIQIRRHLST